MEKKQSNVGYIILFVAFLAALFVVLWLSTSIWTALLIATGLVLFWGVALLVDYFGF